MEIEIDNTQLERAIEVALVSHKGQVDKVGKSYILHPLAVMLMGKTLEEQIVGVLHDVIEDTSLDFKCIKEWFGDVISDAVDSITRRSYRNFGNGSPKELYDNYIQRCGKNPLARKVKIYDLLHNMSPERMSCLPENEKGIIHRYKKALEYLQDTENVSHQVITENMESFTKEELSKWKKEPNILDIEQITRDMDTKKLPPLMRKRLEENRRKWKQQ